MTEHPLINSLSRMLREHSELPARAMETATNSGNRALIQLEVRTVRRVRGEIVLASNNAKQAGHGTAFVVKRAVELVQTLDAALVALVAASDRADEPDQRRLLSALRDVLRTHFGIERQKALFEEAVALSAQREAERGPRPAMAGGNIISLGASGGSKVRR